MRIQNQLTQKLTDHLRPAHIDVINESNQHNVPPGSESHFKVVIVSNAFQGQPLINRHRIVYDILSEEMSRDIHALSIHPFTENEWQNRQGTVHPSPQCRGRKR